jgi:hypothetical protein
VQTHFVRICLCLYISESYHHSFSRYSSRMDLQDIPIETILAIRTDCSCAYSTSCFSQDKV